MTWVAWPLRMAAFIGWYAVQMAVTNVQAVGIILGLRPLPAPLVVRMVTRCRNEREVALLSVLVSLTPGTLVLGTRREAGGWVLYVHDMYAGDRQSSVVELGELERRLLAAVRRVPNGVEEEL